MVVAKSAVFASVMIALHPVGTAKQLEQLDVNAEDPSDAPWAPTNTPKYCQCTDASDNSSSSGECVAKPAKFNLSSASSALSPSSLCSAKCQSSSCAWQCSEKPCAVEDKTPGKIAAVDANKFYEHLVTKLLATLTRNDTTSTAPQFTLSKFANSECKEITICVRSKEWTCDPTFGNANCEVKVKFFGHDMTSTSKAKYRLADLVKPTSERARVFLKFSDREWACKENDEMLNRRIEGTCLSNGFCEELRTPNRRYIGNIKLGEKDDEHSAKRRKMCAYATEWITATRGDGTSGLKAIPPRIEVLQYGELVTAVGGMAQALAQIHRTGLLHNDIHTENVMFSGFANLEREKSDGAEDVTEEQINGWMIDLDGMTIPTNGMAIHGPGEGGEGIGLFFSPKKVTKWLRAKMEKDYGIPPNYFNVEHRELDYIFGVARDYWEKVVTYDQPDVSFELAKSALSHMLHKYMQTRGVDPITNNDIEKEAQLDCTEYINPAFVLKYLKQTEDTFEIVGTHYEFDKHNNLLNSTLYYDICKESYKRKVMFKATTGDRNDTTCKVWDRIDNLDLENSTWSFDCKNTQGCNNCFCITGEPVIGPGQQVQCKGNFCRDRISVSESTNLQDKRINVNETVAPICRDGYAPKGNVQCTEFGLINTAECVPTFCEENIWVSKSTNLQGKRIYKNETVAPICRAGYAPKGNVQCTEFGLLSSTAECVELRCDKIVFNNLRLATDKNYTTFVLQFFFDGQEQARTNVSLSSTDTDVASSTETVDVNTSNPSKSEVAILIKSPDDKFAQYVKLSMRDLLPNVDSTFSKERHEPMGANFGEKMSATLSFDANCVVDALLRVRSTA